MKLKLMILLVSVFLTNTFFAFGASDFSSIRIKNAVEDYINDNAKGDIEIEFLREIATQSFNFENVKAVIQNESIKFRGIIDITIRFESNGRIIKYLEIPVKIIVYQNAAVASKTIPRGIQITKNDLIMKRVETSNIESPILRLDEVEGKKVNRNVGAGTIISQGFISEEQIIKRGEKVTIIVQSGAVQIKTLGTALEDASAGQSVRVKRDGSVKKALEGIASEDGSVVIDGNNYYPTNYDLRGK
jgi:flagella basal body P-ring formation protein FlgA